MPRAEIEPEIDLFLEQHDSKRDEAGRQLVVRIRLLRPSATRFTRSMETLEFLHVEPDPRWKNGFAESYSRYWSQPPNSACRLLQAESHRPSLRTSDEVNARRTCVPPSARVDRYTNALTTSNPRMLRATGAGISISPP